MDKVPPAGFLLIGWLTGMGLKYLWEVLRLPGYGIKIFQLPSTSHTNYLGADDLALLILGVAIILVAKRDRETIAFGLGLLLGIGTSKAFEVFDTTAAGIITPASFAPFPAPA